jgi:hypothetical protein
LWQPKAYAKRRDFLDCVGASVTNMNSQGTIESQVASPSGLKTSPDASRLNSPEPGYDALPLMVWSAYVYKY